MNLIGVFGILAMIALAVDCFPHYSSGRSFTTSTNGRPPTTITIKDTDGVKEYTKNGESITEEEAKTAFEQSGQSGLFESLGDMSTRMRNFNPFNPFQSNPIGFGGRNHGFGSSVMNWDSPNSVPRLPSLDDNSHSNYDL